MDSPLHSLKDVEGVYGSFLVDHEGRLLIRDVPRVVSNASLQEAGPRLARIWAALPEDDPPRSVVIEFASHRLFVRYTEVGSLCVFAPPNVNQLELEMAANFVGRELVAFCATARAAVEPDGGAPESGSPAPELQPRKPKTVVYRGTRYTV